MKIFITSIILYTIILSACDRRVAEDAEKTQSDSLRAVLNEKKSVIDNFIALFKQVQRNLDTITKKQRFLYVKTEKPESLKMFDAAGIKNLSTINSDIRIINEIITNNRKTIEDINKKLKNANIKNNELDKDIEDLKNQLVNLNKQLTSKEDELTDLKNRLDESNLKITSLETTVGKLDNENWILEQNINEKAEMLHTAYYIVGTSKELEKENVIDKKGGLLGIGKTSQLSNDFKAEKFNRIDYNNTTSIPIDAKKLKIITSHPSGSYQINNGKNGDIKNILINNPTEFWEASKYLVVIKN